MSDCKVIVVCGNPVRECRPIGSCDYHLHPQTIKTLEDLQELWKTILEIEETVDGGVHFDTVIICNGEEAYSWWKQHNNKKTANGTLVVVPRRNHGGSFAGYDHAYRHLSYEGFLFTEEDILVFGPSYYRRIKERFLEEPRNGYVCVVGISRGKTFEKHCHGGVGYTTRKVLDTIVDEQGRLPYPHRKGWHKGTTILRGEIPLTATITHKGFNLVELHEHTPEWNARNLCMPAPLFSYDMLK
jgi:hypothetical protein